MDNKSISNYQKLIKKRRNELFGSSYDLVYKVFCNKGFDKKESSFFVENASFIVEELRNGCWDLYVPLEKDFNSQMLTSLIDDEIIKDLSAKEAVVWFAESHPDHIYQLSLSNTQSRRSRAGKEFEIIIELVLLGAGISIDSQGNIGKKKFLDKDLCKLVDLVSPGVVEYNENKHNTVLISAKTTLRERWQEVPEEMSRTGAREMYLAAIDTSISKEVLETLYENGIILTTTKAIKSKYYANTSKVITFEDLVKVCAERSRRWESFDYTIEQSEKIRSTIEIQQKKHKNKHPFVMLSYADRLEKLKKNE